MDPHDIDDRDDTHRLPRTRGDGPDLIELLNHGASASPHTRGWTRPHRTAEPRGIGFPAHAGMDPARARWLRICYRLPRTRGDGPCQPCRQAPADPASPHTRGWTLEPISHDTARFGFPAHAGMDPALNLPSRDERGLPRTRGDGPHTLNAVDARSPASPHTRGWTPGVRLLRDRARGFPAHAGMDPDQGWTDRRRDRLPRTRGDGPAAVRARCAPFQASPHTRGWTPMPQRARPRMRGFPAHAGMDPIVPPSGRYRYRLPRTRGDGPSIEGDEMKVTRASPHTRGWTQSRRIALSPVGGFPAHAGMDPIFLARACAPAGLPRTRGDGPR